MITKEQKQEVQLQQDTLEKLTIKKKKKKEVTKGQLTCTET